MKSLYLLFFLMLILSSCGRKTAPLPIEKSIPEAPTLEIEVTTLGFNLWITLPDKTKGGFPLTKIKGLILEREEIPISGKEKSRIKQIKLKPKLHSAGRIFLYSDTDLRASHLYKYKIKIEKDFLVKTPFTEEKSAYWTIPPNFPQRISYALTEDKQLLLTWTPPTTDLQNQPLSGELFYRVSKIINQESITYELRETRFLDSFNPEIKVCYRLQALLNYYGTIIPGPQTGLICPSIPKGS